LAAWVLRPSVADAAEPYSAAKAFVSARCRFRNPLRLHSTNYEWIV